MERWNSRQSFLNIVKCSTDIWRYSLTIFIFNFFSNYLLQRYFTKSYIWFSTMVSKCINSSFDFIQIIFLTLMTRALYITIPYLIFVTFFTPTHFQAWKFYTQKCVNSRQKWPYDKSGLATKQRKSPHKSKITHCV